MQWRKQSSTLKHSKEVLSPEMICCGIKTSSTNPTKQQLTGCKWSLALQKEQIPSGTIGLSWWVAQSVQYCPPSLTRFSTELIRFLVMAVFFNQKHSVRNKINSLWFTDTTGGLWCKESKYHFTTVMHHWKQECHRDLGWGFTRRESFTLYLMWWPETPREIWEIQHILCKFSIVPKDKGCYFWDFTSKCAE